MVIEYLKAPIQMFKVDWVEDLMMFITIICF